MGLLFFLAEPGKLRCLADVDEKKNSRRRAATGSGTGFLVF